MKQFISRHPQYEFLRKRWLKKQQTSAEEVFDKHGDTLRHLTLSGLGSLLLLGSPNLPLLPTAKVSLGQTIEIKKETSKELILSQKVIDLLPKEVRKLTAQEEASIEKLLSAELQMNIKSEVEGIRLNRSYGFIGGEQHLYRYPGDSLYKHAENTTDWAMFGGAGIAPGLGAWGYFAPSESSFSQEDKLKERYYIAVQTFLAPGFAENFTKYRDFFKYRKMLVVNPKTGQAVVTVIGDAGPAEWTGKHLGGSPEVMHHLGLSTGPRKGEVLYFFISDPQEQIPLGLVQI